MVTTELATSDQHSGKLNQIALTSRLTIDLTETPRHGDDPCFLNAIVLALDRDPGDSAIEQEYE